MQPECRSGGENTEKVGGPDLASNRVKTPAGLFGSNPKPHQTELPTWKPFAILPLNTLTNHVSLVDSLPKGIGDISTSTLKRSSKSPLSLVDSLPKGIGDG